jgi:hypothetical protein
MIPYIAITACIIALYLAVLLSLSIFFVRRPFALLCHGTSVARTRLQ